MEMNQLDLFSFNNFFEYYRIVNLLNSFTCILITVIGTLLFFKGTKSTEFIKRPFYQKWLIKISLVGTLSFALSTALYNTYTRIDNLFFHIFILSYFVKELLDECYKSRKEN